MSSEIQHVSDTAFWVATYRAMETERADALFQDHYAKILIGDRGQKLVTAMKSYSKYTYWTLSIRTRLIDDYIYKYVNLGITTIINVGAGLDTRPYRLKLPSSIKWIEIDFPEVVEYKTQKLKDEKPICSLERIGLDLSNRTQRKNLFSDLNQKFGAALILTEGVIPYLEESMVSELGEDLKTFSNFRFWIADYYTPAMYAQFQNPKFSKLLGNSPFRFFPQNWFGLFEKCGWVKKEIQFLSDEGERLGRSFPISWWMKPLRIVVGKEKFANGIRVNAFVVFEKK